MFPCVQLLSLYVPRALYPSAVPCSWKVPFPGWRKDPHGLLGHRVHSLRLLGLHAGRLHLLAPGALTGFFYLA